MGELAGDVLAVLDHLKVERFVPVGHSMGGMIAQTLALGHPDRIERMVLVNSISRMTYSRGRGLLMAVSTRVVSSSTWDYSRVRERLARWAAAHISPEAYAIDDVGFPKDGYDSPGVARMYCGALGARISITVSNGFPRGLFGRVAVPLCGRAIRVSA
ncbi:alpha/beta fold hydrolase [Micrococcus luteus]